MLQNNNKVSPPEGDPKPSLSTFLGLVVGCSCSLVRIPPQGEGEGRGDTAGEEEKEDRGGEGIELTTKATLASMQGSSQPTFPRLIFC